MKKKGKEKDIVIKRTSKGFIVAIMIIFSVFFVLMGVAFVLGISSFDDGIYTKFDVSKDGNTVIKNKIQIYDVIPYMDNNSYSIEGYLKNISAKDFNYVTIEYTLYDLDGVIIDRVSSTMDNLAKGKKWHFAVNYNGRNRTSVHSYELTKVTVY